MDSRLSTPSNFDNWIIGQGHPLTFCVVPFPDYPQKQYACTKNNRDIEASEKSWNQNCNCLNLYFENSNFYKNGTGSSWFYQIHPAGPAATIYGFLEIGTSLILIFQQKFLDNFENSKS